MYGTYGTCTGLYLVDVGSDVLTAAVLHGRALAAAGNASALLLEEDAVEGRRDSWEYEEKMQLASVIGVAAALTAALILLPGLLRCEPILKKKSRGSQPSRTATHFFFF